MNKCAHQDTSRSKGKKMKAGNVNITGFHCRTFAGLSYASLCAVVHGCNGRPSARVNKINMLRLSAILRTKGSGVLISSGAPIKQWVKSENDLTHFLLRDFLRDYFDFLIHLQRATVCVFLGLFTKNGG